MAVVTENSLKIYRANESKPTTIDLKGRSISYFNWMPDRNYAIMGLYDSVMSLWLVSMQMIQSMKWIPSLKICLKA